MRKHLPSSAEVCFAIKANPFLINGMKPLVDRFEICSFGEYLIAKECGVRPEKMFISGVTKKYEKRNHWSDYGKYLSGH